MNAEQAKRYVVVGTAGTVALATIDSLAGSEHTLPDVRVPIGGFVAGIMLGVLAEVYPDAAGKLAALMFMTAAFVYGGPAFTALSNITKGANQPPAQVNTASAELASASMAAYGPETSTSGGYHPPVAVPKFPL